ncbi:MAG: protein kinase [Gemmatimonadales bacterium]
MTDLTRLTAALSDRYTIERELGAGGMATVYLAEDLKHHRKVAVKVLRPELAAILGAERFLKEIEVTANLQHPNILPLYDSGEADTFLYYVMPFIEGESLRDKLDREKQLGVADTIEITKAVAAALSFAHTRGVVHRDIKPENILLQEGQALVADFGIALAVSHIGSTRLTETGLSLGTPQYMSPEQAMGDRELDARSDVYSLGAVVYEMLAGEPPHTGSTAQAIVARILSERPASIRQLREAVPPNVEDAVLTALDKTPADRFVSATEFVQALTNPAFTARTTGKRIATRPPSERWKHVTTVLAVSLAAAVVVGVWGWLRPREAPGVARLQITLPEGQRLAIAGGGAFPLDLSRDGTRLVYVAEQDGVRRLMVRSLNDFTARELTGTEGAFLPFFSPDGEWVGYFAEGELRRVSLSGGAPITIAQSPPEPRGASWGADGTILFSAGGSLYRVPFSGGDPAELEMTLAFDTSRPGADNPASPAGSPRWPHYLPGGTHALVTIIAGTGILDLESGDVRYLFSGIQARYLPTGHLMFNAGQERIRTVPFDLDRLEITGPEAPALEGVFRGPGSGAANFVVSQTGTLVYVAGGFERSLWHVDRNGRESPIAIEQRGYRFPRVSPDGNRIAVIVDPRPSDVWLVDLRRVSAVPLTTGGHHVTPGWAPDGERLAVTRVGDVHWLRWREGGELQRVASRPLGQFHPSWSPDDLILVDEFPPETGRDILTLDLKDGTQTPFLATLANEGMASFSPDGRWVAYASDVSGIEEVYLRPFPGPGRRHTVSVGGGTDPRWSSDGTELFYRSGTRIWAVDLRTSPTVAVGSPHMLFVAGQYDFSQTLNWDVGPDGRFVMVKGDPSALRQFQVVLNWFQELAAEGTGGAP